MILKLCPALESEKTTQEPRTRHLLMVNGTRKTQNCYRASLVVKYMFFLDINTSTSKTTRATIDVDHFFSPCGSSIRKLQTSPKNLFREKHTPTGLYFSWPQWPTRGMQKVSPIFDDVGLRSPVNREPYNTKADSSIGASVHIRVYIYNIYIFSSITPSPQIDEHFQLPSKTGGLW